MTALEFEYACTTAAEQSKTTHEPVYVFTENGQACTGIREDVLDAQDFTCVSTYRVYKAGSLKWQRDNEPTFTE